ncbi:MAG: glycosyltransferase involved in cell wall biosynthesis [Lentimonas sp.]|jgi:glycosyltransferase involved in cell wall biosynthesis
MFLKWNAGTENAFLSYAKALKESGFNVINLVHPEAKIIPALEKNNLDHIKTKFLGKFGKSDIFTILYFKYLIKKHRIDLVLAHQGRLIQLFKKSCTRKTKLIGINHGHNPKHSVGTDLAITLNSKAFKETIKLGQRKERITLLPNGIDLSESYYAKKEGIDKFTIGSYGRFSFEKGYDILIESLNILNIKNVDFKCFIGGSGIEEKNLKRLIQKYNLQEKIQLIGWVTNQKEFLKKIDLFILPSRREEQGLTVLESMKNYTPVLATENFGCLDLIKDKENGFLTPLNDAEKMAEKVKFIINNRHSLDDIAKNAYHHLRSKYSYQTFKSKLLKTIKSI